MTLKELQEKRNKALADAKAITDKGDAEKRELTAEERTAFDKNMADVDSLKGDIERREKLDKSTAEGNESRGRQTTPTNPGTHAEPSTNSLGMPDKDFSRYSINRAIDLHMEKQALNGIEAEVHQEMLKRGFAAKKGGIAVPWDLRLSARALGMEHRLLNTTTGTGGVNAYVDTVQLIDLLRARLVLVQAGARVVTGLNAGTVSIPRQSGGATAYYVTESNAPTASNQTLDQVQLTPKTCGAYTDISRQWVKQTAIDAQAFVQNDLMKTIALKMDAAGLNGLASAGGPTGILQNSGITTVDFASAAPTWPKVVEMETAVAAGNADAGKLAYIFNPQVKGQLKTTAKFSNTGFPIWENGDIVNGYKAFATTQMSASLSSAPEPTAGTLSNAIFGNFDDMIIAMWGEGVELLVDPYTGSSSGTVRITAFHDHDIKLRHAASFCKGFAILDS